MKFELNEWKTQLTDEEIIADMCTGSEIEFRRLDDDGFVDADSTIRIEDIIAKTK